MPAADLVVISSRIVTPEGIQAGAVVVRDGTIVDVVDGPAPSAGRLIDAGSAVVLPGFVDSHVHVNEPGRTDWEGFASATRAAAAGGTTTIIDMPLNSVPVTTTVAALEAKAQAAAGKARVDYGFWGGVVPDNLDHLASLWTAGVLGFKCFLVPSGIDEFAAVSERELRPAMKRLAELGAVLLAHCEVPGPIRPVGTEPTKYATWLASRPPAAELEAIDLLVGLAHETGCAVHIVHLSTADGLARIAAARAHGVRVTVETCPHYLTFAAEDIPDGFTVFKCAPPIRDSANRERLWTGLTSGDIDLVATDHSPSPPELKRLQTGNFVEAWGGVASLELSCSAVWTAGQSRDIELEDLARWLAAGPARLAGLARKGRIAAGYDADLVIFDPEAPHLVIAARLHQRHKITPYAGMTLTGVVRQTFLRGRSVYDEGRFPDEDQGAWVKRG
jgi:allantoinase